MSRDVNDIAYNLRSGGYEAERSVGIETIYEWNGFKAGEKASLHGVQRGTIRRFVTYRTIPGKVYVDFLPEGYQYSGIETDATNLKKVKE